MTAKRKQRLHAQKLLAKLVESGQLELVDGADRDALVDHIVEVLAELDADERECGGTLGAVLERSRAVAEVFVEDDELDDVVDQWMRAVHGTAAVISDDRNPEIEAKLLAEHDDELASVYADWLIERGNPLGELFACAMDPVARRRVLTKHAAVLWGAVAEHRRLLDITWTRTGAGAITVQRSTATEMEWGRLIAAVLDRPFAAFCRSLSIGPLPEAARTQFETLLAIVGSRVRPGIRELAVTAPATGGYLTANVDMSELATGFPSLASLRIASSRSCYLLPDAPLRHPTLEQLDLNLSSTMALHQALDGAELPRLRRLARDAARATVVCAPRAARHPAVRSGLPRPHRADLSRSPRPPRASSLIHRASRPDTRRTTGSGPTHHLARCRLPRTRSIQRARSMARFACAFTGDPAVNERRKTRAS